MSRNKKINDSHAIQQIQKAHRKKTLFICFIILVVVCIIGFFTYFQAMSSHEKTIAKEYDAIEQIYQQENLAYQQKVSELKDKNPASSNELESTKIDPNYEISMPQFYQFALKYPQDPFGWLAALRSSTYFIQQNKLDEAKKELELILPHTNKKTILQIKLRTTLAGIYASQNLFPQALKQLSILENYPHNPLKNQSLLLRAQILIASNNIPDAKKALYQIIATPALKENTPPQQNGAMPPPQTDEISHQAKILLNKIGI